MRKIDRSSAEPRQRSCAGKVVFLGYDEKQTALVAEVSKRCREVWHTSDKIENLEGFDLGLSYGYRHILGGTLVSDGGVPVVNLHIGYLPFNRGAHPNFWSFYDGTPSGVSIHLIDKGINTGSILYRKHVNFSPDENTFSKIYARLMNEIEKLFLENIDNILTKNFNPHPQQGAGTYHDSKDLPAKFGGWDCVVEEEIARLARLEAKTKKHTQAIIDEIESIRKGNNVNWMNLLRLAFEKSPKETKKILSRINTDDNRISELFKRLEE